MPTEENVIELTSKVIKLMKENKVTKLKLLEFGIELEMPVQEAVSGGPIVPEKTLTEEDAKKIRDKVLFHSAGR